MPQNLKLAQTDSWSCVRARTSRNGLAVMPTAGPWPQVAQVVALDGGLEMEAVIGFAVGIGAPPVIPSPNSLINNNNRLYMGGSQSGALPCVTFGGVKIYVIGFEYAWAILSPEGLDGSLPLGVVPWDSSSASSEYLPAQNLNQNLINTATPAPLNGQQPQLSQVITGIEHER